MSTKLKPLRKDEELAAVPLDQPVLVDLGAPAEDEGEKEANRDDADGASALEKQLADAKAANEREKELRLTAEREARESKQEVERVKAAGSDTEKELLTSSLAGAQSEEAAAKKAFKEAFEQGDPDAMADAQAKISRAAARVLQFEGAVADFDEQAKVDKDRPKQEAQVDIVTAIDRDPKLMPAEREWLKEHTDALTDPVTNNELSVAYNRAIKAGHKRGTPGYFKFLDEFMGYAEPDAGGDEPETNASERASIMGAPVSREPRSSATGRPTSNSIHLTSEQRELARSMGLSDIQYARGVQRLQAEKKADPEKYNAGRR